MSGSIGVCPVCGGFFYFDRKDRPILLCGHLQSTYSGQDGGIYTVELSNNAKEILMEREGSEK